MTSQNIFRFGFILLLMLVPQRQAFADVCVWRDPDRTMNKLFPEAQDYLTVTKKMTPEVISRIEKQLGSKLDDSEKAEFNFYDIKAIEDGKSVSLGAVMALAGKGDYGAIEIVIGTDPDGKIRGIYIQRSREKANKAIKSDAFLNQFIGRTAEDPLEFGKDIEGLTEVLGPAEAIRLTVKKMLIFQKELSGQP